MAAQTATTGPHGVLIVDKPVGPTSHDLVARARRVYGTRRVGHAGTLDPLASGVLVLLFGEGTKLAPYLTAQSKRYCAQVCFGRSTDTDDAQGGTTAECELGPDWLTPAALSAALQLERERTLQVPPVFSALKVRGTSAHRLARMGKPPELEPRPVTVHELIAVQQRSSSLTLELHVSKGYYVRSLARDLGQSLGVPAHLAALRRFASGPFALQDARPWPLSEPLQLLTVTQAVRLALPTAQLTEAGASKARLGQTLTHEHFEAPPPALIGATTAWLLEDTLVALGEWVDEAFAPRRGFNPGC